MHLSKIQETCQLSNQYFSLYFIFFCLTAGIGSDTDTELMVNPWSDGEFHSQSTESCTLRNTEEIQPFGESSRFRAMCDYNYMTTPMSSCSAVQQCNSISVVENVKEMTGLPRPVHLTKIECIEVGGPALPHTKTVVALGGTTEEVVSLILVN